MLAGWRSQSKSFEVLVRPHFPSNLHNPKATPETNAEAKKALAIKLLKIYYIIAHCQEENQNSSGVLSFIYSAAESAATTVRDIGKQIANKVGYGEDSDTILSICDEIKTQIEHAKTYQQYVDLCSFLFGKAVEATVRSSSPRRVPLFFAIMSLMQHVIKTTPEFAEEWSKKVAVLRASFHSLNEGIIQLASRGDSPNQKEQQLLEVIKQLIILDDVEMYPLIFRLRNPYPKIFTSDFLPDNENPFLSQPFLSDQHQCDLYNILDNQLAKEQGGIMSHEKMPVHTIINKNYPLCLQPDIAMFCLYNMANMSLGFATAEAMKDYDKEKETKLRILFTQNQTAFIARNLPIEMRKKTASDKSLDESLPQEIKYLPELSKEAKDAKEDKDKGKEEEVNAVEQDLSDGIVVKQHGVTPADMLLDDYVTDEDGANATTTSVTGFGLFSTANDKEDANYNNEDLTPSSSKEIF